MYKEIVVAVDDSETSQKALLAAIKLAQNLHVKLCIAHVVDVSIPASADMGVIWIDLEKYQTGLRKNAQELLKKMEATARAANINVATKLIESTNFSRISEKIIENINTWKPDLLVLGTHGRRGFHRFLIGSVAEDVIRMADVPVLLIRGA